MYAYLVGNRSIKSLPKMIFFLIPIMLVAYMASVGLPLVVCLLLIFTVMTLNSIYYEISVKDRIEAQVSRLSN